jgi:serine/threonine protein kinase
MSETSWGEIEDLLLAAHQRTAEDYEQFVRRKCHDPILRDTITGFLKRTSTSPDLVGAPPFPGDDDPALASGSRVGPYVVLHRLGLGGMGEVFLARDSRLDRPVALKCLVSSDAAPQDLRDRVVREARVAARINHPHVAAVHDVVEHDGRMFMVMEYVEGESLAVLLKGGPLPEQRVVELGRQMATALAAAHRVGIIHRDLKPANVQVTPDGSVKILDFGIATAHAARTSVTTRTDVRVETQAPPVFAGTLGYMSPEQMLGQTVDERSDIFSLSIVLFEMATGRPPVESRDPLQILLAIVRGLPRADGSGRTVSESLADVIAKGLASDPRNRYQSAAEMAAALDALEKPLTAGARSWPRVARPVAALALVPVLIWSLGRISSIGYNTTLERTGAFAVESWTDYFIWGTRSMVAPCVYGALAIVFLWALRFVLRLMALWSPAERRLASVRRHGRMMSERLALYDPVVLAQALAGLGLVALIAVTWRFNELILAWGTRVSTDPMAIQTLAPLIPENENERVLYRAVLTVSLLVFCAGLVRVVQLRARLGTRRGGGALLALASIVASLLLLIEVPYRIFFRNKAPVAELRGMRCYVIGEDSTRRLLYCPGANAPRNKIVDKTDPAVRLKGEDESIFTPPFQ